MDWQDIENAPKDGLQKVGCYLKDGFAIAVVFWWSSEYQNWATYGGKNPPVTHWMPLPPPPVN